MRTGSSQIENRFEELVDETKGMIYNLGLRLFKNVEDALDFSQDVYLQAYASLRTFRGESKFSTWLYSLALNHGLNKIKKDKRYNIIFHEKIEILDSTEYAENRNCDTNPLNLLTDKEKKEAVEKELNSLPEMYRIPLLLFYYEKMSYTQIAEKLGVKEGTLKSYIFRGKRILKNKLLETSQD